MDRRESICIPPLSRNNENSGSNHKKNSKDKNGLGMQWTNERHSNFLSLMEARFVRNMIGKTNSTTNINTFTSTTSAHPVVNARLDRFVPDISESTLDSHRSAHTNRVSRSCNRQKERAIIRPYKLSHDQVVPQAVPQPEDKAVEKGV